MRPLSAREVQPAIGALDAARHVQRVLVHPRLIASFPYRELPRVIHAVEKHPELGLSVGVSDRPRHGGLWGRHWIELPSGELVPQDISPFWATWSALA